MQKSVDEVRERQAAEDGSSKLIRVDPLIVPHTVVPASVVPHPLGLEQMMQRVARAGHPLDLRL